MRVHFNKISFADYTDLFQDLLNPEIDVSVGEDIPDEAAFEVLVHPVPTRDWIAASPKLRAVVVPWAGIPAQMRDVMRDFPDISVHNLHHNNYNTAELGFALLLAAAKRVIPMDQALRRNDWTPRYTGQQALLLRGKHALILGFGQIGQALAAYCLGLGMKVSATRKHPDAYDGPLNIDLYPADLFRDVLTSAQVLLIALPLTEETRGMIGEKELALMPPGSILVNIGRGPIVQQQALYDALVSGHLRAAASDVWYHYPESESERTNTAPADLPFGELENFVLSPHRGGLVESVEYQRAQALAALLNAAHEGKPIPNQVDLLAGY